MPKQPKDKNKECMPDGSATNHSPLATTQLRGQNLDSGLRTKTKRLRSKLVLGLICSLAINLILFSISEMYPELMIGYMAKQLFFISMIPTFFTLVYSAATSVVLIEY